jgi:hypothetical protein
VVGVTEGPSLVDFVENAFESDVDELYRLLKVNPHVVLARRQEVLGLMSDTWAGPALSEQRSAEGLGELWPVLPRSAPDVVALARSVFDSDARLGTPRRAAAAAQRHVQSLLLYAHGVHLPNPLRLSEAVADDGREFLRALSQLCSLAPLIRAGVVRVFEPEPAPRLPVEGERGEALDQLAAHIGLALMSYEGNRQMHRGYLRKAADVLVERAVEHLLDLMQRSTNDRGSLLLPTIYDKPAVAALLGVTSEHVDALPNDEDAHRVRLDQLAQLQLPGLVNLDLRHMASIRDDNSFGVFRSDMATALIDADADLRKGRLDAARLTVGEHMDAGLARFHAGTRSGVLKDALLGRAVGWGVGAALAASLAGLQGFLMGLLGGAIDLSRKWPTDAERALRAHFVELGATSLKTAQVPEIDFVAFSTDQLWGPSLGLPRKRLLRRTIVSALLDELEPTEAPPLDATQAARLAVYAESLIENGDYRAYRLAAWIAYTISSVDVAGLDGDTRLRLARVAGTAGEMADDSLLVLAKRSIDPVLRDSDPDFDVGELEALNFMRQRMSDKLSTAISPQYPPSAGPASVSGTWLSASAPPATG